MLPEAVRVSNTDPDSFFVMGQAMHCDMFDSPGVVATLCFNIPILERPNDVVAVPVHYPPLVAEAVLRDKAK